MKYSHSTEVPPTINRISNSWMWSIFACFRMRIQSSSHLYLKISFI